MAKNNGLIQLKGTLENVTFYSNRYGNIAQKKSSLSGEKVKNDPQFRRTQENMAEFGLNARCGKYFRDAIGVFIQKAYDPRASNAITGLMNRIGKCDTSSQRGSRSPAVGILTPEGQSMMLGFDLNGKAKMNQVMKKPYSFDEATGILTVSNLDPKNDLAFPKGASHVQLSGAYVALNFESGQAVSFSTNEVSLALNAAASTVTLTPTDVPTLTGSFLFFVLLVGFSQEVNGEFYSLSNGAYNALQVAWVGG